MRIKLREVSAKVSLTLPEELMTAIKAEAEKSGESVAEFFRRACRERLARLRASRSDAAPLRAIRGLVKDEEADLSSRVDAIIYGEHE